MMNKSQVAAILGLIAARDNRTIGEVDVRAWHEDIGDLEFDDARRAISLHFQESTDYLMPVHVRRIAKQLARERHRVEREERERKAIEAETAARGPIRDRSPEVADLLARLAEKLGPSDPTVLRRREWVRHERHRRLSEAPPNPHYQGPPPPGGWPVPGEQSA